MSLSTFDISQYVSTHQISNWSHRSTSETQETLPNLVKERAKYLSDQVFPLFDEIAKALQDRENLVKNGKFSSDQVINIA